jgi:hypothetical protein
MDFLLSLSVKAKEKLSKASLPQNANKSVMYADQTLSEEDVSDYSRYSHVLRLLRKFIHSQIPTSKFTLQIFTNGLRQNGL